MTPRKASVVVVVFAFICTVLVFFVAGTSINAFLLAFFRNELYIELNKSWPSYGIFIVIFFAIFRFIISIVSPSKDTGAYVVRH